MGNIAAGFEHKFHPDVAPHPTQKSKFDPLYGFPEGRKEKVMKATYEEMYSAKIPLDKRDYCAHLLIDYSKCRREKWPWVYRCHDSKHAYEHCEYDEFIDRMKDYEREKRLLKREKRLGRTAEGA